MAARVLPLLRLGHPMLRKVAAPLTRESMLSERTQELVRNMFHTMKSVGGIGIAAPQVGVSEQVVVIDMPEYGDIAAIPSLVMFNPVMEFLLDHEKVKMWESCLSVPGMTGKVERYNNVLVHYYDLQGNKKRLGATGFNAAVFQHEIDHLQGVLYTDNLTSPSSLYFNEEWERYHAHEAGIAAAGEVRFFEK